MARINVVEFLPDGRSVHRAGSRVGGMVPPAPDSLDGSLLELMERFEQSLYEPAVPDGPVPSEQAAALPWRPPMRSEENPLASTSLDGRTDGVEKLDQLAALGAGPDRPWWDAVVETPPGEHEAETDDDRPWADAEYHAPPVDDERPPTNPESMMRTGAAAEQPRPTTLTPVALSPAASLPDDVQALFPTGHRWWPTVAGTALVIAIAGVAAVMVGASDQAGTSTFARPAVGNAGVPTIQGRLLSGELQRSWVRTDATATDGAEAVATTPLPDTTHAEATPTPRRALAAPTAFQADPARRTLGLVPQAEAAGPDSVLSTDLTAARWREAAAAAHRRSPYPHRRSGVGFGPVVPSADTDQPSESLDMLWQGSERRAQASTEDQTRPGGLRPNRATRGRHLHPAGAPRR